MLKIRPRLLLVVFLYGSSLATLSAGEAIVFDSTTPTNDLTGSLAAEVRFAQSQILPAKVRAGDRQPHLTGHRKCLVLVRPLEDDNKTPMQMAVVDTAGKTLGIVDLDPPDQLPKTAYFLEGLPDAPVDFHLDAEPIAVRPCRWTPAVSISQHPCQTVDYRSAITEAWSSGSVRFRRKTSAD